MTKQEFLDFCHEEFTKRGFKKRKKTYPELFMRI